LYEVDRHRYVGFLDITDIVHHVLHSLSLEDLKSGYETFKAKFLQVKCQDVANISGRNPWKGVESKANLRAVIDLLNHYEVHRIPVITATGELVTVLSQSRVVQYITPRILLFECAIETVGNIKLGYRDVFSVTPDSIVKDAFELMRDKGVSGVGVISEGKLVESISVSDLRHVGYAENMFERLFLSVKDFLALARIGAPYTSPVIVVTPLSTIAEVAEKLDKYKIHRVFVVESEESMKPIGVISLFDFLKLIGQL